MLRLGQFGWFQDEVLSCSKFNGDDCDDVFLLLLPISPLISEITVHKLDRANFGHLIQTMREDQMITIRRYVMLYRS